MVLLNAFPKKSQKLPTEINFQTKIFILEPIHTPSNFAIASEDSDARVDSDIDSSDEQAIAQKIAEAPILQENLEALPFTFYGESMIESAAADRPQDNADPAD